tara:strand:+ start:18665 stop:19021 length:357 start_codon:yes stop_codon:yes gene_type:complete
MSDQLRKRSKFSFYAFGDAVSEKDFMANNFMVSYNNATTCFSFKLSKDLDYSFFEKESEQYDTFVFEDFYVIDKIVSSLKMNMRHQVFTLRIQAATVFELKLTNIKVQSKAVIFQSFQ